MWMSTIPASRMTSIWYASSGRFRTGRIGFGRWSENGYILAPLPAARITPTISPLATGFSGHLAAHQFAHHPHGIEGAYLLAFFERAAFEPDRYFGEARAALGKARRELGLEVEGIRRN